MTSPLDDLPQRNESAKRIYAYAFTLAELAGRIKVGETTRSVKQRIGEQVKTVGLSDVLHVLMDEPAITADGRVFGDTEVHNVLKANSSVKHLVEGGGTEWFECELAHVRSAYSSIVDGAVYEPARDKRFSLREEQSTAITLAHNYFEAHVSDEEPPRFLWNAKMRFGKTFAAYHLAKLRNAHRVLVVSYKPAVSHSWRQDLQTHRDFDGWIYFARDSDIDPTKVATDTPLVCFSSLQDLRGRTADGSIKAHNQWIHDQDWDLVIIDEYHYGAWNDATRELLAGEERSGQADVVEELGEGGEDAIPEASEFGSREGINGKVLLSLSGTPFRAIASNDFASEQIFNWTYTAEQRAKAEHVAAHPNDWNPYGALPSMHLLVYELPDNLKEVAINGLRNEFDLNEFFKAEGGVRSAEFKHKDQVQAWLDWMRGQDVQAANNVDGLSKPFPFSNTNVLPHLNHSVWFLPSVSAVFAMARLLAEPQNHPFWGQYRVCSVAGQRAGIGVAALPPVQRAIGNGFDTKSITLTCGKLLTGVTVPQWSAILMLCNLSAPETYFQAAFRVQSAWSVWNPNGDDPNEEQIVKPTCLVVDFAPTRALRLYADYGMRLGAGIHADKDVADLNAFLPVLGFDGTAMRAVEVDHIIDVAFATTSVDVRRMDSRRFINPNTDLLSGLTDEARTALEQVARVGQDTSSDSPDETTINETGELDESGGESDGDGGDNDADEDTDSHEANALAERLTFLSKRVNAFMYLSERVESNLHDVLTTEEALLFHAVMDLGPGNMAALVDAGLFNEQAMRLAIHQFRRADVTAMSYTGIDPRAPEREQQQGGGDVSEH